MAKKKVFAISNALSNGIEEPFKLHMIIQEAGFSDSFKARPS